MLIDFSLLDFLVCFFFLSLGRLHMCAKSQFDKESFSVTKVPTSVPI